MRRRAMTSSGDKSRILCPTASNQLAHKNSQAQREFGYNYFMD